MKEYGIKLVISHSITGNLLITDRRRNLLVNVLLQAATRERILRQGIPDPDVVLEGGARV